MLKQKKFEELFFKEIIVFLCFILGTFFSMGINPDALIFQPIRFVFGNFSAASIILLKIFPAIIVAMIFWGLLSKRGELALAAGFFGFFAGFAIVTNIWLSVVLLLWSFVLGYIAFQKDY